MIARASGRMSVVLAVGTTIAGGLPVFLIGALFVQIQRDIHAPAWVLGAAVAAYWAAAAATSLAAGRVVSFLGVRSATLLGLAASVVSLTGSALYIPAWPWLLVWAMLGGLSNGVSHPAANQLINLRVTSGRLATAFGIKQAAIPFATFLAGLSVPVVALTLGWHWGFVLGSVLAIAVAVGFLRFGPRRVPGRTRSRVHVRLQPELVRYLVFLASVTSLAAAAASSVTAYAVITGIERGLPVAWAGVLLSVGGLLSALTRVIVGRMADRSGSRFALSTSAVMMLVGAGGVLLISIDSAWTFAIGMLLAVGIGWGWPGLTHFVVSRVAGPATPSATGIVQIGTYIGSGAGPLLFGLFLTGMDDRPLWMVVGGVQLGAAAIAFALSRRRPPG